MFLLASEGSTILNKNNSCPSNVGLRYNWPVVEQKDYVILKKSYIVMV